MHRKIEPSDKHYPGLTGASVDIVVLHDRALHIVVLHDKALRSARSEAMDVPITNRTVNLRLSEAHLRSRQQIRRPDAIAALVWHGPQRCELVSRMENDVFSDESRICLGDDSLRVCV